MNFTKIFIFFLLFSLFLRWPSFFPSVLNHDESTYLVIGRDIANGRVLYEDITDMKPPGIFFIIAGMLKITGDSIFAFRVFTALIIALTAFFLSLSVLLFVNDKKTAFASGGIYILMTSIWLFFGISPNTEHFVNFFSIAGAYFFFSRSKTGNFLLAGLLWGLGFMIKYIILFDVLAFVLFFLIKRYRETGKILSFRIVFNFLLQGVVFLVPLLAFFIYFKAIGHLNDFLYINVEAVQKYPSDKNFFAFLWFLVNFHVRFLPVLFIFYYAFIRSGKLFQAMKYLSLIWMLSILIAIFLPGNYFGHYTIQLMLPVSFFAGIFFHKQIPKPGFLRILFTGKLSRIILGVIILALVYAGIDSYLLKSDTPRKVAAFINKNTESKDVIYTGNHQHIVYFLTGKVSPTPYVHRGMIISKRLQYIMNIDEQEEIKKIVKKKPAIIIVQNKFPNDYFNTKLKEQYKLVQVYDNQVCIFKLK